MNMNRLKKAARVVGAILAATAVAFGVGLPQAGGPQMQQAGGPWNPSPAQSPRPSPDDYKKVATWAVWYADMKLGAVEGKATCRWEPVNAHEFIGPMGQTRERELRLPVQCEIRVQDPKTRQFHVLTADAKDITLPSKDSARLRVVLHGQLPGDRVQRPTAPALALRGGSGTTATISIKNGAVESEAKVDVSGTATPDADLVTLTLDRDVNGVFRGTWQYAADPLTERSANESGAAGIFGTLRDEDVGTVAPPRPGGFLGVQTGPMIWRPLPPTIYAVHTLEDEAAFAGRFPRYPHEGYGGIGTSAVADTSLRTLVIIGENLPMLDNDPVSLITADKPEPRGSPIEYHVLASNRAKNLSPVDRDRFERAWLELTQKMNGVERTAFHQLDAVIIEARVGFTDPGLKSFTWGAAQYTWPLQYGDNTAHVGFKRVTGHEGAVPKPPGPEWNWDPRRLWAKGKGRLDVPHDEAEDVPQVALPEKVFVEVETGIELNTPTVPVIVGGSGMDTVHLTATRVELRFSPTRKVYRTPPLVFARPGAKVAAGGAMVVQLPRTRVYAAVDPEKMQFLRASVAEAEAEPATDDPMWKTALSRAVQDCGKRPFSYANWPAIAREKADTIRGIPVTFGDHAAMLILRTTFLNAMRSEMANLQSVVAERVPKDTSDGLIDAWYRTREPAVTQVPNYPLATFTVSSPAGPVPFAKAYDDQFIERTFHPMTTAKGQLNFLAWRRQASLEVIKYELQTMTEAVEKTEAIGSCDREALLALTGSGFRGAAAQITPLMMKLRPTQVGEPGNLAEPDSLARAYVKNLDTLANAVQAQKELTQAWVKVGLAAAMLVPVLGEALGIAAVLGVPTTTWGLIAGVAGFAYESFHDAYQTYQGLEEVRFAWGAYAAIGIDRYLDAESRATTWHDTLVSIFGNALLLGVPVAGQVAAEGEIVFWEGLSAWRGERLAAQLGQAELAAVRALPRPAQRDLAMAVAKQQVRLHRLGVVSEKTAWLTREVFDSLGQEARGLSPIVESPENILLAQDALAPAEQLGLKADVARAVAKRLRAIKDKISAEELLREGRLADAEANRDIAGAAPAPPLPPAHPPLVNDAVIKPELLPNAVPAPRPLPGMPVPGVPARVTVRLADVDRQITLDLGKGRFGSMFFGVYDLNGEIPADIRDVLAEAGVGADTQKVVKVLDKTNLTLIEEAKFVPGIDKDVVARSLRGQDRLKNAGVPHVRIAGFVKVRIEGLEGETELIFQERQPKGALWEGKTKLDLENFNREPSKHEPLVQTFKKLADGRLAMLDAHPGNFAYLPEGRPSIAKVLDSDFIGTYEELTSGPYGVRLAERIDEFHRVVPGVPITDAKSVMYMEMVIQKYVRWDEAAKRYVSGTMNIEMIERILPDFQSVLGGQAKRGWWLPFHIEALRGLVDIAGVRARDVFVGRPALAAA